MVREMNLGMIFITVTGILVAIALIPTIANLQAQLTDKINQGNELQSKATAMGVGGITETVQFNITHHNYDDVWKQNECPVSSFVLMNHSHDTMTLNTHYRFTAKYGNYSLIDHAAINGTGGNNTYVNYTYCPDGYITDSGARGVAGMIMIFSALALMIFAGYYVIRYYTK